MDTYFNFPRFLLVLKRDLFENAKTALFGMLTILSIFSFILAMISFQATNKDLYDGNATFYMTGFFIVGLFFSGMAFKDFRNKEKAMSYLMIPASSLEKLLSMLFLSTVGFIVSYTILFEAFNLLNILIIKSFPHNLSLSLFNPFIPEVWEAIMIFLPIQAVFLVGAATFRKVPLFYTALYFFIFLLIYGFAATILMKFYTGSLSISEFGDNSSIYFSSSNGDSGEKSVNDILSVQTFLFFFSYLLAPIFWVVAWFKINEKEV